MHELVLATQQTEDLDQIASLALDGISSLLPADFSLIVVFDQASQTGHILKTRIGLEDQNVPNQDILIETFVYSPEMREGRVFYCADTSDLSALDPPTQAALAPNIARFGFNSFLVIPLVVSTESGQQIIGSISIAATETAAYSQEHIRIATEIAGPLAIAVQRAQRTAEHAAQIERLKDALIDMIGHNLRTYATTTRGYIHLAISTLIKLMREGPTEELVTKLGERLKQTQEQNDCMITIMQGTIYMIELEAELPSITLNPSSVNSLITDIRQHYQTSEGQRSLTIDSLETDRSVRAERTHLINALRILVDNALLYSPSESTITITAKEELQNGTSYIAISVSDTGPGIPADELESIFERFKRGAAQESSGQPIGIGLGLATARMIVEAHRGRITVNSQPDKGSTFTIWLPATESEAS